MIAAVPGAGSPCAVTRVPVGVRKRAIGSFPYVVDDIDEPSLKIVTVSHVHRMPGYWLHRLTMH